MPRIHDEAKGRTKERSDAGSADSEVPLIHDFKHLCSRRSESVKDFGAKRRRISSDSVVHY
jgi:hypothetical protein